MKRWLLALACLAAAAAAAHAQDETVILTGTLKTISDRGTILIGTRDSAVPFSFLNKAGQPIGFSVDLCHGIAEDVAASLNRELLEPGAPALPGIRIVYVPVTAEARLPKLVAGEIDLECGSTTATAERAKTVAFSPVFFLAGTKMLVAAASAIGSYRDLAGRMIAVIAGTTNAAVMKQLGGRVTPPLNVVEEPDAATAYDALKAGKAAAFARDDVLLAGFLATRADGERFRLVGDYLSYEPYAIALRRDDPAFAALVRGSFERMAGQGELSARYRQWFTASLPTGGNLGLPMSPHLQEMFRTLGEPD